MANFWSNWVLLLTCCCLTLVVYILLSTWKVQRDDTTEETVDHEFDGIKEYDNPMPMWWIGLFIGTLFFGLVYLLLYPGIWPERFDGLLSWSSSKQLTDEQLRHKRQFQPIFEQYAAVSIEELIENPKALAMGKRIFLNNCALCHGSDAGGTYGFPRLNDNDWLWGESPAAIKLSVLNGRNGVMPAWGTVLGIQGVKNTAAYVRSRSGLPVNASAQELANGETLYMNSCASCHGVTGTGNTLVGAPNLTDQTWIYGNTQALVEYTIRKGRNGIMPGWQNILGKEKVHLVSAYVYSLSQQTQQQKVQN